MVAWRIIENKFIVIILIIDFPHTLSFKKKHIWYNESRSRKAPAEQNTETHGRTGAVMDLKQLEYYLIIAQNENLSRAAEELGLTEAALSRILKQLETDAGVRLFTRRRDGFSITSEGKLYLEYVSEMLRLKDRLYRKLRSAEEIETLRIGIGTQRGIALFSDLVCEKDRGFSGLKTVITEGRAARLIQLLRQGRLDVVLTAREKPFRDDMLSSVLLREEPFVLALARDHALAGLCAPYPEPPPVVDPARFGQENFILNPLGTCDGDIEMKLLKSAVADPNVLCFINDTESMLKMVAHGIGVTLLPLYTGISRPELFRDLCWCRPPETLSRYVQLIYQTDHNFPPLHKKLFAALKDIYQSEISEAPFLRPLDVPVRK